MIKVLVAFACGFLIGKSRRKQCPAPSLLSYHLQIVPNNDKPDYRQLRAQAKLLNIPGFHKMKSAQLSEAIHQYSGIPTIE